MAVPSNQAGALNHGMMYECRETMSCLRYRTTVSLAQG